MQLAFAFNPLNIGVILSSKWNVIPLNVQRCLRHTLNIWFGTKLQKYIDCIHIFCFHLTTQVMKCRDATYLCPVESIQMSLDVVHNICDLRGMLWSNPHIFLQKEGDLIQYTKTSIDSLKKQSTEKEINHIAQ